MWVNVTLASGKLVISGREMGEINEAQGSSAVSKVFLLLMKILKKIQ